VGCFFVINSFCYGKFRRFLTLRAYLSFQFAASTFVNGLNRAIAQSSTSNCRFSAIAAVASGWTNGLYGIVTGHRRGNHPERQLSRYAAACSVPKGDCHQFKTDIQRPR